MAFSLGGYELGSRGTSTVGSRYQAAGVKAVTGNASLCVIVISEVYSRYVLQCPIDPFANSNPVHSHSTRQLVSSGIGTQLDIRGSGNHGPS
jgi:hypothetical protein